MRDTAGEVWWQAEVNVRVKASGSGRFQFADRVRVGFNLATEGAETGTETGWEFYRTAAMAVTLEAGRAAFRFYLPPGVVQRDRLQGPMRFLVVDLSVGGAQVPVDRRRVGPGLTGPEARAKLNREGTRNDGVMRPEYLSPFANSGTEAAPVMLRAAASEPR
ncbi:MAG: hypothetical protein J6386_18560 [Candidatus Synoicihabitans palmerolidicus]|nr:hypothetical protein [Candidatus Synoicihabitans palmerolidicus]